MSLFMRVVVCLLVLVSIGMAQNTGIAPAVPGYAEGELLVRFRPTSAGARSAKNESVSSAHVMQTYRTIPGVRRLKLPAGMTVADALTQYRKDPSVLYAEPNYRIQIQAVPNDPQYVDLWGMNTIGAETAWDVTTGSSQVVIGVIDTGVDYTHPDLAANMFRNEADCNNNGIDDDGNGYVDDCYGIDTLNDDSDPMDDHFHGTHVSGTIGAVGNNRVGVAGVNWNVRIAACKFLDASGSGLLSDAIACMDYFAAMKDRGVPIVATNNSWGSTTFNVLVQVSQTLRDAIELHMQKGILFIVAATNSGTDNDFANPFSTISTTDLPNLISVAAINSSGKLAPFSNFGRHSVHLAAPGVNIVSTVPNFLDPTGYHSFNGTSMATPHVTGAVALLKAWKPDLTWWEIRNLILAGGTPSIEPGKTISQKTLNVAGAMNCANQVMLERVRPSNTVMSVEPNTLLALEAIHVNCSAPNGPVQVIVNPGNITIGLRDDGLGPDKFAGDGTYSAQWTAPADGSATLSFPNGDDVQVNVLRPYQFSLVTAAPRAFAGTNVGLTGLPFDIREIISPFPILFGGAPYTNMFVNWRGTLTFGQPWSDVFSRPLPFSSAPNIVAALWTATSPGPLPDQNVFWDVLGQAPNRELVVEWRSMGTAIGGADSSSDTVRYQMVFFEAKSDILFIYPDVTFGGTISALDNAASATVGIQTSPTQATQYSFRRASLHDGNALLWTTTTPDLLTTPKVSGVAPDGVVLNTGTHTLTFTGANFTPQTVVRWHDDPAVELATTFVNPNQITAAVPAVLTTREKDLYVTINAPGNGESNALVFSVLPSPTAPRLLRLQPGTRAGGSPAGTMSVVGLRFDASSKIFLAGSQRNTRLISDSQVQTDLTAEDMSQPGLYTVFVQNATEGSNFLNFMVTDFGLRNTGPDPVTVHAGRPADFVMMLESTVGTFDQPVTLSCTAVAPASTCSFSPSATITPRSPTFVTVTVQTKAAAANTQPATQASSAAGARWLFVTLVPFGLGICMVRSKHGVVMMCVAIFAVVLVSCGGGGGSNAFVPPTPPPPPPPPTSTAPGTYNITVQAVAGSFTRTVTAKLIVQ